MPELGPSGSVRGGTSNGVPYRDIGIHGDERRTATQSYGSIISLTIVGLKTRATYNPFGCRHGLLQPPVYSCTNAPSRHTWRTLGASDWSVAGSDAAPPPSDGGLGREPGVAARR
jgi:hypothetical protein